MGYACLASNVASGIGWSEIGRSPYWSTTIWGQIEVLAGLVGGLHRFRDVIAEIDGLVATIPGRTLGRVRLWADEQSEVSCPIG